MPASSQSENLTMNNGSSVIQPPQQQQQQQQQQLPVPPPFPESNTHTIATLQSMLHSQEPSPSEYFILIIKKCKSPPKIEKFVIELTNKVRDYLKINGSDQMTDESLDATNEITLKMFYKLIDCILPEETEKSAFDPNILLNQDAFIKALYACAVEIVFFSLSEEHLKFPKVLEVLNIAPYYFYRIIEVVVRQGDLLTREIVKHLNTIEESVLESMAWKCDSPLWRAVIDSGLSIPSYEDVNPNLNERQKVRSYKLSRLPSFNKEGIPNSPGAPLADKFLSPCLKRNYTQIENISLQNEQNVNNETPVKLFVGNDREVKIITIPKSNEQTTSDNKVINKELIDIQKENKKPKRSGSLALFFRKFYQLAAVRLKDLCDWLKITNWDSIWTCFESTIINNIGLLFERHLDQLLLCSIYVVCKIEGLLPSFVDMMRCYRYLPQATSSVYRNVLIKPDRTLDDIKNNINDLTELYKVDNEIRGDIVKFYNEVFVHKVKTWAKKYRGGENERVVLSPLPIGKTTTSNLTSRVSGTGLPILLRSLDHNSQSPTNSPAQHSYIFSRSPAKDLQSINRMVNCKDLAKTRKQLLNDDDNKNEQNNIVSRKMKDLYTDRMNVNNQNQN
ncbi:hypothetical protein O3M35_001803 [Rhynocoris fuscipes]|uniref:Retinoblastoma-associated protein A-box domain-containing protein n=1 Tax=Rhynocoris fuscipes TaxID=488301 RepID=A0AAW1CST5_9HEMI